jgi:hypothetical protein
MAAGLRMDIGFTIYRYALPGPVTSVLRPAEGWRKEKVQKKEVQSGLV